MSFKNLNINYSYNSEKDTVLDVFYIPALNEAYEYYRVGGYFSSSSLYVAARGISQFILNGGKMKLIANVKLNANDYKEIEKQTKDINQVVESLLVSDISSITDACLKDHVAMLGWMLSQDILEIKIGYIKDPVTANDILHQKVGILKDNDGNTISFSGSNNESAGGWLFNSEKFKVFCSWEEGADKYIKQDESDFFELWNDISSKTSVIPFPEAVRKNLVSIAPKSNEELQVILKKIDKYKHESEANTSKEIKLFQYQNDAIDEWFKNNCVGLLEMATGSGKTFTAIGALHELLKKEDKLITIISCPFLHLVDQWKRSLNDFGIELEIEIANSKDRKWKEKIQGRLLDIKLNRLKKFIILTTHNTISSEAFREIISATKSPIFLIGDEVHGMGSSNRIDGLLENYNYRLGLSATPLRYFDELGTKALSEFFDKTVYEFNLHDAINEINPLTGKSYLVPYEYYPIFVDLNIDEFDKYIKISSDLNRLYRKSEKSKSDMNLIEKKLRDRADIIKNADNKYDAFLKLLEDLNEKSDLKNTLVYCSPQQIERGQEIIRGLRGIKQHRFTSKEDAIKKDKKYDGLTEREFILNNFDKGGYQVLVAIKCLDEGVDVPSTKTAILMCSTGNPKEYIQRRGRVLRRCEGKDRATIYDFIVLPDLSEKVEISDNECKIVRGQFKRIEEFVGESLNRSEVLRELFKIKLKYKVLGEKTHAEH